MEKWMYTYGSSGLVTEADYYNFNGISWSESERFVMTYNTDSTVHTVEQDADSSYGWVRMYFDTFGYSTGIRYATYREEYEYADSGILMDYSVWTKHVSGLGLPDTQFERIFQYDGRYSGKAFTAYTYDSYEEPTLALTYRFIFDTSMVTGSYDTTYNKISTYYYEVFEELPTHNHNNAVTNVQPPLSNIKIYPNPAGDEVNIVRPGISNGVYTSVEILNASGQTVRSERLPWLRETETVSLKGLPAGVYWVVVGEDRQVLIVND